MLAFGGREAAQKAGFGALVNSHNEQRSYTKADLLFYPTGGAGSIVGRVR